jgi:hypothetical protein
MRARTKRRLEATLQKILAEYPDDALERIQEWAAQGKLSHDWSSCLNAAAVGHPVDGPAAVQEEMGIPAFLAEGLAQMWDRLGDEGACDRRVPGLVSEILESRARRVTRSYNGFTPGAQLPAGLFDAVGAGS